MTAYGKKQAGKGSYGNADVKFANISWTAETDKQYLQWVKDHAPSLEEGIDFLINAGYRVSITWDDNSDCPKVSVTGSETAKNNKNIVCTSWGESIEDCVLVSIFKIEVLFPGQNLPTEREKGSTRR